MFLISWQGPLLGVIAIAAYMWALGMYGEGEHARTVALLASVGVQTGQLFNCRSRSRTAFRRFFANPYIFAAVGAVAALQVLAVGFPPLMNVLGTVPVNGADLLVIALCVVLPVAVVEFTKMFADRRQAARAVHA